MPLEVLNLAFVLLGGLARRERAEISTPAGLWIDLAGIEAVFARLELAEKITAKFPNVLAVTGPQQIATVKIERADKYDLHGTAVGF